MSSSICGEETALIALASLLQIEEKEQVPRKKVKFGGTVHATRDIIVKQSQLRNIYGTVVLYIITVAICVP